MENEDEKDGILRYDQMVEGALRQVVRQSLEQVASQGLPGEHHFYITFRTDHPGVEVPVSLRRQYPAEMTIVLQFQFWGLEISDEGFAVTLSFADKPERLSIPFVAITAFADPSVRFGLQFESGDGTAAEETGTQVKLPEITNSDQPIEGSEAVLPLAREAQQGLDQETGEGAAEDESEKVVTLDRFRKK